MEFQAVLLVFTLLAWQSFAQYPSYNAVPLNCGKVCFPTDGYVTSFGTTLCMCRSELCDAKQCGQRQRCIVKRVWLTDVATCQTVSAYVPSPRPLLGSNPSLSAAERCSQPPLTGNCRALIKRFYYDSTNNSCTGFVYGGCGRNDNNFESLEECLQTCQPGAINGFSGSSSSSNNNNNNDSDKYAGLDNVGSVSRFLYNLFLQRSGQ